MPNAAAWRLAFRVSALLALIAGLLLFAGATRTEDNFSWTIDPPQTAAFLGAAYWAAAVLFTWAATQRSWQSLRIAVFPELAVAVVLLVATYMHLDKFHDDLFGYFWVSVYAVFGVGLFVPPSGLDGAGPWALPPLTARAIAAFLLGFAIAAAIALRA